MDPLSWAKKNALASLLILAVLALAGYALYARYRSLQPATPGLAKRLKDANVKLFMAAWCGYSQKQLAEFGGEKDQLEINSCGDVKGSCPEYVKSFPTWVQNEGQENQKVVSGYIKSDQLVKEFLS